VHTLAWAPFDFIVLVMSPSVEETDAPFAYLFDAARVQALPLDQREREPPIVTNLLQEKTVHALGNAAEGRRAFVALHNVKVTSAAYEERHIRSRGRDFGIHFGTLTLTLNDERHAMRKVRVGVIDVRERIHPDDTAAVAAWVCLGKPAEGRRAFVA
jgi:hypothetical protein